MSTPIKKLSKVRYEALAGYCKSPDLVLFSTEMQWLCTPDESILITIAHDHADNDYAPILLAKDLKERYRFIHIGEWQASAQDAVEQIQRLVEKCLNDFGEQRAQGDEKGAPVDFFKHIKAADKLNQDFVTVTTNEGYSPAVEIIKPMMRWFDDADGNFIEQFQTSGFNTRLWELYLFAMFVEAGYAIDKSFAVPDICAKGLLGEICLEATSVNPSQDAKGNIIPPPTIETEEQYAAFIRDYMPIRFAGPLCAKLQKKYWEKPGAKNKPFLIAIQDFHAPGTMVMSSTALPIYLYGKIWEAKEQPDGSVTTDSEIIKEHKWGAKIVPSGFFGLKDSENISAVVMNASATISKFNRMGLIAGFGSKSVRMIRKGHARSNKSIEPIAFLQDVGAADYSETWIEGLDVFHNPNAKIPLPRAAFPGAAHHYLARDGDLISYFPDWHPQSSLTQMLLPEDED